MVNFLRWRTLLLPCGVCSIQKSKWLALIPSLRYTTKSLHPIQNTVRQAFVTFIIVLAAKHIEDGEQIKRLWQDPNWSFTQRLKERVRIIKAIFFSQGWPPSTEALRARKELRRAHFRILCLRRKLRRGTLVPEDIECLEEMSYGRYARALNQLEHYTSNSSPVTFTISLYLSVLQAIGFIFQIS